jgi:predicted enzyme related to lactoylglutathione lyase
MTRYIICFAAMLAVLAASASRAETKLFASRIGAVDAPKLAKFYESAFGLQEVNRLELPGLFEIMLNFGGTVNQAKGNTSPQIIIIRRESDDLKDTVPHLVMTVSDIAATVAAVKAAGGQMDGALRDYNKSKLGFAIDPSGNRIEIIQPAQ